MRPVNNEVLDRVWNQAWYKALGQVGIQVWNQVWVQFHEDANSRVSVYTDSA